MILEIGSFKQKASWFLVDFVFGCIFVIIILLFIMQKTTEVGLNLRTDPAYVDYYSQ